jgi:hypothetical protein
MECFVGNGGVGQRRGDRKMSLNAVQRPFSFRPLLDIKRACNIRGSTVAAIMAGAKLAGDHAAGGATRSASCEAYELATQQHRQHEFKAAAALYRQHLEKEPADARALAALAACLMCGVPQPSAEQVRLQGRQQRRLRRTTVRMHRNSRHAWPWARLRWT